MDNFVNKHAEDLFRRFPELQCISENLYDVYFTLKNAFVNRKTIFLCGNGGSGADCEHIVGELQKSFCAKREINPEIRKNLETMPDAEKLLKLQPGLRAISLLSHPALSTAFINDVDPLLVFAQQLFAMGEKGDVLIGISTSGNAKNIYYAFQTAKALGISTVLLSGKTGGICKNFADHSIIVPQNETYRIQEYHLPIYHTLCLMIESALYEKE